MCTLITLTCRINEGGSQINGGSSNFLISNKRGVQIKDRGDLLFIYFYRKLGKMSENLIKGGIQIKCGGAKFKRVSNKRGVRLFGR